MRSNLITNLTDSFDLHIKINSINDFNRVILLAKYVKSASNIREQKTRLNNLENILIAFRYEYKLKEKVFSHRL